MSLLSKVYLKKAYVIIFALCVISFLSLLYCSSCAFKDTDIKENVMKSIMEYPMGPIVDRCKKDYKYTDEDMMLLERELKRFFVLSAFNKKEGTGMYSRDVDNLWHTFILFTKQYTHFCAQNVGSFLHHVPELDRSLNPERLRNLRNDFQMFIKNYQETFDEEIHSIWFLDMCEEHTA